jgi:hypothetical protein
LGGRQQKERREKKGEINTSQTMNTNNNREGKTKKDIAEKEGKKKEDMHM